MENIESSNIHSCEEDESLNNNREVEEPNMSLVFESFEDAYEYYANYGRKMGFNVRKKYCKKRPSGEMYRLVLCCSKEGFKKNNGKEKAYSKPDTRVGCEAGITFVKDERSNIITVLSFEKEHNHDLVQTPMKHLMRVNRSITASQKAFSYNAERSGLSIKQTLDFMSTEVGGYQNLGFMRKDYENYVQKVRRIALAQGDAKALLEYFQNKQRGNPFFFYTLQLDNANMVTNIFWADGRSIEDYHLFGDVVCFDTTYRTNNLDRPFAPIVGVNHHKQTIIFGAALLYEETTETFKWLFNSFLTAMSNKHPQTILTDQSAAMAAAIQETLPHTVHRLCVWHIYQNAAKHLSHAFNKRQFTQDFGNCVYDFEYEDEWLAAWEGMLDRYDLRENKWLKNLFELREKWAVVYGRSTFTADMKSTQRSESINSVLKKYVKHSFDIIRFLENFERVLKERREAEREADFKMLQTVPVVLIDSSILLQASKIYSHEIFKIFQKEFINVCECGINGVSEMEQSTVYKVLHMGKESYVTYIPSTADFYCSCKKFEYAGILCRHVLKVMKEHWVTQIPTKYFLKRWTKEARISSDGDTSVEIGDQSIAEPIGLRYGQFCRNLSSIASVASRRQKLFDYGSREVHKLSVNLNRMELEIYNEESSMQSLHSLPQTHEADELFNKVTGIKRTKPLGRPRGGGRMKSALEKLRKGKTKVQQLVKGAQERLSIAIDEPYYPQPPVPSSNQTWTLNDYQMLQEMDQSDLPQSNYNESQSNFNESQSSVQLGQ